VTDFCGYKYMNVFKRKLSNVFDNMFVFIELKKATCTVYNL